MLRAALTIAGLDPSGGAGLAADLRGFEAAGVWGMAVCAALTVQSTRGLRSVHPVTSRLVVAQAEEVLSDARLGAVKTGALGSAANARAVAALLGRHPRLVSVVDPVMLPSRALKARRSEGAARLDGPGASRALRALAAVATLTTPNALEAGALLERAVVTEADAAAAATELVRRGAHAVLVKGGHVAGAEAVDWLATASGLERLARPRLATPPLHGTGCTLASLIAGRLAGRSSRAAPTDRELLEAVRWARGRLEEALRRPLAVGHGLAVLDARARPGKDGWPGRVRGGDYDEAGDG